MSNELLHTNANSSLITHHFLMARKPNAHLHLCRRAERRSPRRQSGPCSPGAASGHRVCRVRRRTHGRRRLPLAVSALLAGGDVVRPRPGQRTRFFATSVAGRPLFPPSPTRCGDPHRLPRLPLVVGASRPLARHSRLLLCPAPTLGLGRLARRENSPLGGPRSVLASL